MDRNLSLQIKILLLSILANFIAQVPYVIHLYGVRALFTISFGFSLMSSVFALFLIASVLFILRKNIGYWLLVVFLSMEYLFYLWNFVGSIIHGYAPFYHVLNPDPILRVVFIIGYINFFTSGYLLYLLLTHREEYSYS